MKYGIIIVATRAVLTAIGIGSGFQLDKPAQLGSVSIVNEVTTDVERHEL